MDDIKSITITDEALGALIRFQPDFMRKLQDSSFAHDDVSTGLMNIAIKAAQLSQLAVLQKQGGKMSTPAIDYTEELRKLREVLDTVRSNIVAAVGL